MLGKLLKYDFISNAKVFGGMAAGMLIVAAFGPFFGNTEGLGPWMVFIFTMVLFAAAAVSCTLVVQYFYKSLFSDTGYLTLSLPVRPSLLILSKTLVAMFWFVVMMASAGFSILLFFRSPKAAVRLDRVPGFYGAVVLVCLCALFLILTAFFCVTASRVSVKNVTVGNLLSFVLFFAILALHSFADSRLLGGSMGLSRIFAAGDGLGISGSVSFFLSHDLGFILFGALEYLGTVWLLKKHVNL